MAALRSEYPWLSDLQLHTAVAYYRLRPEEIDSRLDRERYWTPERVREEFPFLGPRTRDKHSDRPALHLNDGMPARNDARCLRTAWSEESGRRGAGVELKVYP